MRTPRLKTRPEDAPVPPVGAPAKPAAKRKFRRVDISPIERQPKASDLVASQIRRLILDAELGDDDQLPPETQLAVEFAVSRPTMREAFRILETEGLIEVARGSRNGARVKAPNIETSARYAAFALRGARATLAETYEAQLAIEPYAVRLLTERRSAEVLDQLEARLVELEALEPVGTLEGRSVALARYHLLLVQLTGNRAMSVMAETLARILEVHQAHHRPPVAGFAKGKSEREFRNLGPRSIRKLLQLIRAGDADAAETHWRLHLKNSADFWLSNFDPSSVIDVPD